MTTAAKTATSCSLTASASPLLLLSALHQRTLAELRDSCKGCRDSGIGVEDGAASSSRTATSPPCAETTAEGVFYFDRENGFEKSDITEDASALDI